MHRLTEKKSLHYRKIIWKTPGFSPWWRVRDRQPIRVHLCIIDIFEEETKELFQRKLSKWAVDHPDSMIYLWYDKALVNPVARSNTQAMLKEIGPNLRLRNIRKLPILGHEIRKSLHPGTPVYYRVDLLKVLITNYQMTFGTKYCVFSDIDIGAQSPQQLFDQRTIHYLDTNGYVFNRVGLFDLAPIRGLAFHWRF